MSPTYTLRDKTQRKISESDTEQSFIKKKRKHRSTRALEGIEEQENEVLSDNVAGVINSSAKTKAVTVSVSFGARAERDLQGTLQFYMCDSKGAKSPSQHIKGTIKVEQDLKYSQLFSTVVKFLLRMPIPVTFDSDKHSIMLPNPSPVYLDERSDALTFHELIPFDDPETWVCDGASVAVAVFEKVLDKWPASLYFNEFIIL